MALEDICKNLSELGLFSKLPETMLRQLAQLAEPRSYGAGGLLFHEGAHGDELFVLQKGKVQLQMRVPGRGSIPILTLGPGQLAAWSAVLGTGEMTTSATALEDTAAFVLPVSKLKELWKQDHEFGYRFMEQLADALARRLVATRLQLLDLCSPDAPQIPVKEEPHG
jgi:CRP/FNR family cyclic AMP-dependent transcriptional regulator